MQPFIFLFFFIWFMTNVQKGSPLANTRRNTWAVPLQTTRCEEALTVLLLAYFLLYFISLAEYIHVVRSSFGLLARYTINL